ncbi:hypothetical protein OOT00_15975 [Desulfobotulus sp. H1]|uniref:Uncharacterized protein n=1 Tax=Desulfobotulus pelophilus TaxID=2823377 RepID=A0ABT3NDD6_9BACT|nr:hypothetical protein [Desulfobotulus pelophilus]MCW7755473.1 hypothetical protein [Desulfobotulus pelophilus]
MKNKALEIARILFAMFLVVVLRYVFYSVYGYIFAESLSWDVGASIFNLCGATKNSCMSFLLHLYYLMIVVFSATLSVFIPAILYGYFVNMSRLQYFFLGVFVYFVMIVFDLVYYCFVVNDLFDLYLISFFPVWYGVAVGVVWILIFYLLFLFGRYLSENRKKKESSI